MKHKGCDPPCACLRRDVMPTWNEGLGPWEPRYKCYKTPIAHLQLYDKNKPRSNVKSNLAICTLKLQIDAMGYAFVEKALILVDFACKHLHVKLHYNYILV